MRFGTGFLAIALFPMLVISASGALSITNGDFSAFSGVYGSGTGQATMSEEDLDPASPNQSRPLLDNISPDGWFQSDLTGGGIAEPLQDVVVGRIPYWDLGQDNVFDVDTNGDTILDAYASGGWTGNAICLWQWWNGPNSREDGWWYSSLGTYTSEAAITLNGEAFRFPDGNVSGTFTVEFWYTDAGFDGADESDVALDATAVQIGTTDLFDMTYLQPGNSGEPFSSTQFFAGSGITAGKEVWVKFGDGPDLPPFFANNDFPVLDNLTLSTRVPGDVNNDGNVDAFDLDTIQMNFGQALANVSQGDVYDDDIIDLKDFIVWKQYYPYPGSGSGASAPSSDGGGSNVPEPASMVLLVLGGLLAVAAKRR